MKNLENFYFKQFKIIQSGDIFKTNTDGVLLGAWVTIFESEKVLDIGTGTGIIALMLAQRFNNSIDAIEINSDAYQNAKINFYNSPWKERLNCFNVSFEEFSNSGKLADYHHWVSNPPFFKNSLFPIKTGLLQAKHTSTLSAIELIKQAFISLPTTGRLSMVLPYEDALDTISLSSNYGFFCHRKTIVKFKFNSKPKRLLFTIGKEYEKCISKELIMKTNSQLYTKEYLDLVNDFYTKVE